MTRTGMRDKRAILPKIILDFFTEKNRSKTSRLNFDFCISALIIKPLITGSYDVYSNQLHGNWKFNVKSFFLQDSCTCLNVVVGGWIQFHFSVGVMNFHLENYNGFALPGCSSIGLW
jgi:hypothetical protein